MSSWLCACGAHNAKAYRVCESCGADRPAAPKIETSDEPERRRCPHVADPDALCADCAASIRRDQEEFRRHMQMIDERNERAKTAAEIEAVKRAASIVPMAFTPTCAGCGEPIEEHRERIYEDGRLWHRPCWERQRARAKQQRKQHSARNRERVRT